LTRIIITGGNGFIGRHLAEKILSRTTDSVILVSNTSKANDKYLEKRKLLDDKKLKFYTADIRDRKTIDDIMKDERTDTCIHLAAKTSVADSIKNPDETMEINVKGTLNVLEACHTRRVNNFIFASSAAVYGNVTELPVSEDHTLHPLSPYGTSKMLAEKHVSAFGGSKKLQNTISLRIFNAYGPGQTSESDVITKFAKRLSNGLPPIIYDNGNFTRDFISVDDITEAILLSLRAMELPDNNLNDRLRCPVVLNVGTGIPTSIVELAHKMIDIFGLKLSPELEQGNNSEGVILHSYANTSKAKKALNFIAKTNLETGLRNMIERMQLSKAS
jgi:UDP-glucose 4-epimerase